MNQYPGNPVKTTPSPDTEFPIPGNGGNQDDPDFPKENERSNLDDALDDDNENPVGQTLIDAAENTGPDTQSNTRELEGEVDEDGQ